MMRSQELTKNAKGQADQSINPVLDKLSSQKIEEQKESHLEESFSELDTSDFTHHHPLKNKSIKKFIKVETLPKLTFHEVQKVIEITDSELKEGFFKINQVNSVVSELEAACAGFYKILARHLIPNTHAVYNEKNEYIGVFSENLPGFKSLVANPLKLEDLNVDFLAEQKISIEEMDQIDNEFQALEDEEQFIIRKAKKLTFDAEQLKIQEKESEAEDTEIIEQQTTNFFAQANLSRIKEDVIRRRKEFYERLEKTKKISKRNLENYRIVKGLSVSLTTSYIFMEDDLHRNNLSRDGKRIDFDMSLWTLLYNFKASILKRFRKPTDESTQVTAADILTFPNLSNANPYYWPTRPIEKSVTGSLDYILTIKQYFPSLTENAYPETTNPVYKSLEKNPVFVHHKFKTILQYILLTPDIFKNIARQYICNDREHEGQSMIDFIVNMQMERIKQFEREVLKIPDFITFFKNHGKKCLNDLCQELTTQEITFDATALSKKFEEMEEAQEFNIPPDSLRKGSVKPEEVDATPSMYSSHFDFFNTKKREQIKQDDKSKEKNLKLEKESKNVIPLIEFNAFKKEVIENMNAYLNPSFPSASSGTHNAIALAIIAFCSKLEVNEKSGDSPYKKMKELYEKLLQELKTIPTPSGLKIVTSYISLTDRMYGYLNSLISKIETKYPTLKAKTEELNPEFSASI